MNMYQPMYQHRRPKRMGSYFMPFLSLIILGLIGVLVFQIVTYFQEKRASALENKAAVKIVAGRADMKIWGVDQWTTAIDGSILNEGDQIRTSPGSRAVLTLLNGSVVRLSSDTEVELTGLKTKDSEDEASFTLKNGELWLKHAEKDTIKSTFEVSTNNLDVQALGTTFDVLQSSSQQSAHVVDGKVQVAVKVQDDGGDAQKMRTADTVQVSLGQEVSLDANAISDLTNRKPVDLIQLLADDFRNGDWYAWNRTEDSNGTAGVSVADAVNQNKDPTIAGLPTATTPPTTSPTTTPSTTSTTSTPEVTEVSSSGPLSAPVITSPSGADKTTKTGSVMVLGTVSSQTDKLEVTSYDANGKADPYVLQKYQSGSTSFSYAASSDYGNLLPGSNKFKFVAIAKDGTRSDATELSLVYDKPLTPSDLSAPKVVSFNDMPSSKVDTDSVKVTGTIGKGITKVYVNDFILTKYVMDSGSWLYYAKTSYGNLKDGENTYEVYGIDGEGKKTPVTTFTITKAAATTVTPPTTPTPAPTTIPVTTPAPTSPQPHPAL